ncbi:Uncharacterised protein [Bordetella pertussis]|nr:Uncharacterised protein [Bordetella pertussis]
MACDDSTSRLCARVMRGAASSAKAVSPAAARRCRSSASNGSSMPASTAPRFMCGSSLSAGARTFSTSSQPSAVSAVPSVAPASS